MDGPNWKKNNQSDASIQTDEALDQVTVEIPTRSRDDAVKTANNAILGYDPYDHLDTE
jgi:hypothetical protein